jgi:hypothetical protein
VTLDPQRLLRLGRRHHDFELMILTKVAVKNLVMAHRQPERLHRGSGTLL